MKILDEIIKRVYNLTDDQQKEVLESLQSLQKSQQREAPRLRERIDIDAVVDGKVVQSDTRDISAGGVFINTVDTFEIDKSAKVVFTVSGDKKSFKLQGHIVRVDEDGIAIKFKNITPYYQKILEDLIWEKKFISNKI